MANKDISGLTGGEVTPHLDSRSDIDPYDRGFRHLDNMITKKYGTVTRRPGTVFVVSTIDLDTILPSIVAWQNVEVAWENLIVSTLADNATNNALMPLFVCYENEILCWENKPVVESETAVLSSDIVCWENKVVFYENNIVVY